MGPAPVCEDRERAGTVQPTAPCPYSPLAPPPPPWPVEQSACEAAEALWSGLTLQEGPVCGHGHTGCTPSTCAAALWSGCPAFRAEVTSSPGRTSPPYCLERWPLRLQTVCERVLVVTMVTRKVMAMEMTGDGWQLPAQGHALRGRRLLVDGVWWWPQPSVLGPVKPRDNARNLSDDRKTNKLPLDQSPGRKSQEGCLWVGHLLPL